MVANVACAWGTQIEIGWQGGRQGCGAVRHAWRVVQETGSGSGSEIALGPIGSQPKLALSLAAGQGQGARLTVGEEQKVHM